MEEKTLIPEKAESLGNSGRDAELQRTMQLINDDGLDFSGVGGAVESRADTGAGYQGPDTDYRPGDEIKGETFDPQKHKTYANGQPKLGSKNQLLLKKQFKKSAGQKFTDSVKNLFSHKEAEKTEIPEDEEIPENRIFPPNDEEFRRMEAEKEEKERQSEKENSKMERRQRRSAEKSANGIIFFSGLVVGPEIHRQKKSEEFGDLVDACAEWEEETGHKFDVHPNIAFPIAVFTAVSAMARNEPDCKARMDAAAVMIRQNVLGALGEKIPVLRVFLGGGSPVPGGTNQEQEIPGEKHAQTDD